MSFITFPELFIAKYGENHFNLEKFKGGVCTLVFTIKGPKFGSKSVCFEEILHLNISQNELTTK